MIVKSPVNGQEIDVDALVQAVRDLAKESPENIYLPALSGENCRYSTGQCDNGSCGCIVGQALARIGLDPASFEEMGNSPSASKVVGALSGKWGPGTWLRCVQQAQDSGRRWAIAIEVADEQGEEQARYEAECAASRRP